MRRSPAEEARTLVANGREAALATVGEDGGPWASLVPYTARADGTPVVTLSALAEHGRNAARDPRASVAVGAAEAGRVTLAGRLEATGDDVAFGDFTAYALRIERVRWVGGFARMATVAAAAYHAAEPDPVALGAERAITHLNEDHAHNLLDMARALAGHPEATTARCTAIDRYGLELLIVTPEGEAEARLPFAAPARTRGDLRTATVELAKRARA